jgi:hypothetical protein
VWAAIHHEWPLILLCSIMHPGKNIWADTAIRHFISFENLSVTAIAFGV